MARIDTTQDVVAEAFVARLRDQLELDEAHCYETDEPEKVTMPPSGDLWVTVYAGPGAFDVRMQVGGGASQLMETVMIAVTAYTRMRLDPTDRAERQLHEASRGLYAVKRRLLKALVDHDLADDDGNTFLRQLVFASRSSAPEVDNEEGWGRISIEFGLEWDWDLS